MRSSSFRYCYGSELIVLSIFLIVGGGGGRDDGWLYHVRSRRGR